MSEQGWIFPDMAETAVPRRGGGGAPRRMEGARERREGVPVLYDAEDPGPGEPEIPERRRVGMPARPAVEGSVGGVGLRRAGGLIDRALERLAHGPMSTMALADEVLRLRGNPRVASTAVFTLLGSDPRVRVDGCGIWSLVCAPEEPSVGFGSLEWVVVDVETTGGWPSRGHRIIEVAAVHVSRGRVVGEYATLVNPGRPIPRIITSLTGITNEDVVSAPSFEEVVPQLTNALAGRVFVGHNAGFDWHFVSTEMQRCTGHALSGRRLCTLRVARRLLPHLPSRSLGALAHYLGIEMTVHHRALDDAAATAQILIRFLDSLAEREVQDWMSLEAFLRRRPPSLRRRRRRARPTYMDRA